jgi:hypothetical protein
MADTWNRLRIEGRQWPQSDYWQSGFQVRAVL